MNNESIIIRKVNENDAYNWFLLVNKVWRYAYKDIFPEEVFIDRDNKIEQKVKTFSETMKNDNKNIAYVAEYNGKLVGLICGSITSAYNNFSEYADLIGLYIDPTFQSKGIGSLFKNIFEKWARENGAKRYVIGVLKDNIKARKVYESWGGTLSEFKEDYIKFDVKYPEVFYTYNL